LSDFNQSKFANITPVVRAQTARSRCSLTIKRELEQR